MQTFWQTPGISDNAESSQVSDHQGVELFVHMLSVPKTAQRLDSQGTGSVDTLVQVTVYASAAALVGPAHQVSSPVLGAPTVAYY